MDVHRLFMTDAFADFLRGFTETIDRDYYGGGDFVDKHQDAILLAFEALQKEWRDRPIERAEAGKAFAHQLAMMHDLDSRNMI